jgi:hypothetical protein
MLGEEGDWTLPYFLFGHFSILWFSSLRGMLIAVATDLEVDTLAYLMPA